MCRIDNEGTFGSIEGHAKRNIGWEYKQVFLIQKQLGLDDKPLLCTILNESLDSRVHNGWLTSGTTQTLCYVMSPSSGKTKKPKVELPSTRFLLLCNCFFFNHLHEIKKMFRQQFIKIKLKLVHVYETYKINIFVKDRLGLFDDSILFSLINQEQFNLNEMLKTLLVNVNWSVNKQQENLFNTQPNKSSYILEVSLSANYYNMLSIM